MIHSNREKGENMDKKNDQDNLAINDKDWFDVYWNYFSLLSGQRMQMINFYITVEIVLIGALFALLNFDNRIEWAEYVVCLTISFISLIFFLLDYRTKMMIHWCEELMKDMEHKYKKTVAHNLLPFHYVEKMSSKHKLCLSYSKIFLTQFCVIGLFGLLILVLLILRKI